MNQAKNTDLMRYGRVTLLLLTIMVATWAFVDRGGFVETFVELPPVLY